jgi:hypothetical protein
LANDFLIAFFCVAAVGNKQEELEETEKAINSKGRSPSFGEEAKGGLAMQKSSSFPSERKRVLVYFNVPGRAESIRLAAVVARVSFPSLCFLCALVIVGNSPTVTVPTSFLSQMCR